MPSPLRARIFAMLPLLFLSCALPSAATVLIDTCAQQPSQWQCFGHIEMRAPQSTVRVSSYANHETLVEVEQAGERRRMITTRKGDFVDRLEPPGSPHRHTFAFFGYALGPIFMTLPLAYPDGPESVPAEPVTQTIRIDNNNSATVSTSRGAAGEIRFRIRIMGEDVPPVAGTYRAGALAPLPADFDLRGWYRAPGPTRIGEPPPAPTPEPAPERLEQLR